jgi:hypothetical protein
VGIEVEMLWALLIFHVKASWKPHFIKEFLFSQEKIVQFSFEKNRNPY